MIYKIEESKYTILVYPKIFSNKEEAAKSIGIIKNNILNYPKKLTLKQIAEASLKYVINFSYGKRHPYDEKKSYRRENWNHQQILAIDIDNSNKEIYVSYKEAINLCYKHKIKPTIVYTTFNSTEKHNRYRMLFLLDTIVKDIDEYSTLMNKLSNVLSINGRTIVDTKVLDCCRVFFPGKEIVLYDSKAITKKDILLSISSKNSNIKNTNITKVSDKNRNNYNSYPNELNQVIKEIQALKRLDAHSLKQLRTLINKGFMSSTRQVGTLKLYIVYNIKKYIYYKKVEKNIINFSIPTDDEQVPKPLFIRVPDHFYSLAGAISISKFLGLPFMEHFRCILPNHRDINPSARIELDKNGQFVYHCYGCNAYYNIFKLLEHLTNSNHILIKRYIALKFNINYETEWQIKKDKKLEEYSNFIHSDIFQQSYPIVYKTLKRKNLFGVLTMMIDLARAYTYDIDISGQDKVIFFLTLNQLYNKSSSFGVVKTRRTLYSGIIYLARIGLIECLQEEKIPNKLRIYFKDIKEKYNRQYRINCYSIPELSIDLLEQAEKIIIKDKESNVRAKYFCQEAAIRSDKQLATLSFQNIKKQSKEVDIFFERYKRTTIRLINKQKYTTEKEICSFIRGFSKHTKEKYSSYCLPQLLKELNLKIVSYSKRLEQDYAIINKNKKLFYGISKIIIKKDGVNNNG